MSVLKKVVLLHPFSAGEQELFETDERKEIACVTYLIIDRVGDTKTSQEGKKRTILTMKSLILAQDER